MRKSVIWQALLVLALVMVSAASAWADGLTPKLDEKKGKWGYVDASGEWAIKPKFDSAGEFMKGQFLSFEKVGDRYDYIYVEELYAIVSQKGKYGCLKTTGKWHFKPKFLDIKPTQFMGSKDVKNIACMLVKDEQGWGVIDTDGNWVSTDRYEETGDIQTAQGTRRDAYNNYCTVYISYIAARKNGKWGFIHCFGNDIPFIYDKIGKIQNGIAEMTRDGRKYFVDMYGSGQEMVVKQFENKVKYIKRSYGGIFLLDSDMNIISEEYDNCRINGTYLLCQNTREEYDIYNAETKKLNARPYVYYLGYESGCARVEVKNYRGGNYVGLLDKEGREIIPCRYAKVSEDFNDKGLAFAMEESGDVCRIVPYTREGKALEVSPAFNEFSDHSGSAFDFKPWKGIMEKDNGEKGVMGSDGKMLVPMGMYDALTVERDYNNPDIPYIFIAEKNGKTTYYSENGTTEGVDYKLNEYGNVAKKGGKYAFVDRKTKKVTSKWFESIIAFRDPAETNYSNQYGFFVYGPVFIVKDGGKYGIYDVQKGKLIVPCVYEGIGSVLYNDRAVVQQNGLCGAVNTSTGAVVIPPKYIGLTHFAYYGAVAHAKATYRKEGENLYRTVAVNENGKEIDGTQFLDYGSECDLGHYDEGMGDKMDVMYRKNMGGVMD